MDENRGESNVLDTRLQWTHTQTYLGLVLCMYHFWNVHTNFKYIFYAPYVTFM